jgi:AraC-like DNA-binding protein
LKGLPIVSIFGNIPGATKLASYHTPHRSLTASFAILHLSGLDHTDCPGTSMLGRFFGQSGGDVSYNYELLFEKINFCMRRNPCVSVEDMSKELKVSRRTIQEIIAFRAVKPYSSLRQEILIAKVTMLFIQEPHLVIKEISFAVGFTSASAFARAVKRACGLSPKNLRSRVSRDSFRERSEPKYREFASDFP